MSVHVYLQTCSPPNKEMISPEVDRACKLQAEVEMAAAENGEEQQRLEQRTQELAHAQASAQTVQRRGEAALQEAKDIQQQVPRPPSACEHSDATKNSHCPLLPFLPKIKGRCITRSCFRMQCFCALVLV